MKYIKTFEDLDIPSRRAELQKYNEGDYVLFKAENDEWNEFFYKVKLKIII